MAHVLLFETADPFADGSFDLPLCLHKNLEHAAIRDPIAHEAISAMPRQSRGQRLPGSSAA